MKKIIVTGAAGFLGSHLCKLLLSKNYQVVGVDNFYTGRKVNLSDIYEDRNFEFRELDITEDLSSLKKIDFCEIYNLACPASPPRYQKNPVYTTKVSILGCLNLLELCKLKKAKFFQASTSEVYGDPVEHPQRESYWGNVNCTGVRSCYDEGKRCAESLIFDYHRMYDLKIKIVRIFNTYGPRMDPSDGRVVSNFILQALRNEKITIYGNGSQTRSFCYVDDLVRGFVLLMESDDHIFGPINMGNPGEFTMLELAERVIDLTASSSKLTYTELPKDDPTRRRPDITLAKSELGWQPHIDLLEGLERTIEYYKQYVRTL